MGTLEPAGATQPGAVARTIEGDLRRMADPVVAEGSRRYFRKHQNVEFIGVRVPTVRATVREHARSLARIWDLEEAISAARGLARRRPHELRLAGFVLLGLFRARFTPRVLGVVEEWLDAGAVTDWATTDGLCLEVVSPLLDRCPQLVPKVTSWRFSEGHWRRRTAVVALVPFARKGSRLDDAYTVVTGLLGDDEDLMHKACGWLLREAGKTDHPRLKRYLLRHGSAIPRTTVRYAIERFPENERRALLEKTRGSGRKRFQSRTRIKRR